MSQTDIVGTGRDKSSIYPVMAEVTLLCDAFVFIKSNGIIRTYFYARLTSGAQIVIHDDDAVLPFRDGLFRTGLRAWGVIAVSAQADMEGKFQFAVNQSGSILLNRN